ncbi:MAG: ligase-associated DNA damage response endonuclease PdeM [Chitinophagaceae bacterium]|nr:ligase-associated DNA damage response endonuclease PdeM [Chitinophagaceae bacterium]
MEAPLPHIIHGQTFWLSAERVLYWEEQKALIVSDLHFGKTGHFRKAGIAVPQHIYKQDLQRLFHQVQHFKAVKLIVVGDLFHSKDNKELLLFTRWRKDHPLLEIQLIKGNHDILKNEWYEQSSITTVRNELVIGGFSFIHDPEEAISCSSESQYCFSGHLHPGITIKGLGKQSLRFPCFHFGEKLAVLPAFSLFTGISQIESRPGDNVFAIVENKLLKLQ